MDFWECIACYILICFNEPGWQVPAVLDGAWYPGRHNSQLYALLQWLHPIPHSEFKQMLKYWKTETYNQQIKVKNTHCRWQG